MRKSLVLANYLFKIQRKNKTHLLFMFFVPFILFVFNSYRYGFSERMVVSFASVAPIQMLLFQFGNTFMSHKQSGSLIKYQLLGFKPIQVMIGIGMSTFVFEMIYIVGLFTLSGIMLGSFMSGTAYLQVAINLILLNVFEFSLVVLLIGLAKTFESYSNMATVTFYLQLFLLVTYSSFFTPVLIGVATLVCFAMGFKKFKWHTA